MAIQLSSEEREKYCILIIGATGSGKSSTGNTILGNSVFPVANGLKTETKKAKAHTVGNMTIIDTPTITPEMTDEDAEIESRKWLQEAVVEPNAIVLTINCKKRFSPDEYKLYCIYKRIFRNIIESKLFVVFTRGDLITPEEPFNPGEVSNLWKIIKDARKRYFIYNNKTKDYATMNKELLETLKAISKRNEKEKGEDLQEYGNQKLSVEGGPTEFDISTPRKGRRVLLVIGKSGTGKSSTGNTILGRRCFRTARGLKTQTLKAEMCRNEEFEIIDTPDLPLNMSRKQAEEEVKSWLDEASSIPNAVLLTINAEEEYAHEDVEIFKRLKDLLKPLNVCENLVIVFTRGDLIDRLTIKQSLNHDKGDPINVVLRAAQDRYVIFDNNTKNEHTKREQLNILSKKIELSRQLPERRSLKERKQTAGNSLPKQPITTSPNIERPAVPYINAESATNSSPNEEIRVLVIGAHHEARHTVYESLRRKRCDREDWLGFTEAEGHTFKVINCKLLLDDVDTPESQSGYEEIFQCSKPGCQAVLFVAAVYEDFNEDHYKAFMNTFGENIINFVIIVLVYDESSGVCDENSAHEIINKKLSAHTYLTEILRIKNDEYLPFNCTNKPDAMNNEIRNAFQRILSNVQANKGHYIDSNEAINLIQGFKRNKCKKMDTELTHKERSSDSRKGVCSNSKEHSQKKQQESRSLCHLM